MLMEIQAFDGTHRLGPGGRGYLRVASLRMGVFRNLTRSLFHGNGGKNQCVDRAEHHNAGKTGYNPVPAFFLLCAFIYFSALCNAPCFICQSPTSLFKYSEICYRPDPEYDFSDDLFTGDAAHRSAAGIHRSRAVVAHAKVPVIRHLVG